MPEDRNDLPAEVLGLFAASKGLYYATLAEIAAERPLPADAESASHIAFSIAMEAIKWRVLCPEWAAVCVSRDWKQFEDFECRSLGDAFGIPDHKHAHAKRTARLCAYAYCRVREVQAGGVPLKDSAKGTGALSKVGDELHVSGKQVEKLMTDWRKLCRNSGHDPDEFPKYADASAVIATTLARALKHHE